ncbi:MAG: hypothetical protein IKZ21_01300, partial [Clostridia bacterium]|nr:hypothetical protein [Clostridia bacterium]
MSLIKYRLSEVAKDFDLQSKEIASILAQYATAPKSNQKVLEDDELNIIFDILTQDHQPADLEAAMKAAVRGAKAEEKKVEEPKPTEAPKEVKEVKEVKEEKPAPAPEKKPEAPKPQAPAPEKNNNQPRNNAPAPEKKADPQPQKNRK